MLKMPSLLFWVNLILFSCNYFIALNVCSIPPSPQLISLEHAYRFLFLSLLCQVSICLLSFVGKFCSGPDFFCVCFVVLTVFPCQTSSVSILTLRSLSVLIYAPKSLPIFLEVPGQHNYCVMQFVKHTCFLFSNTFWSYESPFLEILGKIEKNTRFFSATDLSMPMFGTEVFQSRLFSWKS